MKFLYLLFHSLMQLLHNYFAAVTQGLSSCNIIRVYPMSSQEATLLPLVLSLKYQGMEGCCLITSKCETTAFQRPIYLSMPHYGQRLQYNTNEIISTKGRGCLDVSEKV